MFKTLLAIAAVAASALFWAASGSSAPPPPNVTCSQVTNSFSGTAYDLTVPANGYCAVDHATITHDLIVQRNAGADVSDSTIQHDSRYGQGAFGDNTGTTIGHDLSYWGEGGGNISGSTIGYDLSLGRDGGADVSESTIGHDLTEGFNSGMGLQAVQIGDDVVANQPNTVQTGCGDPTADCHVQVGNDFLINGSPGRPDSGAFVFDGICDLSVGHDLSITNRWVTLGIGLGEDTCGGTPSGPVSVGHDLVFSGNTGLTGFFGPTGFGIVGVTVGRDLTVTNNTETDSLQVSGNTVTRNATCRNNNPPASLVGGDPNSIGGTNNGCP
jgi:hypothetical protein